MRREFDSAVGRKVSDIMKFNFLDAEAEGECLRGRLLFFRSNLKSPWKVHRRLDERNSPRIPIRVQKRNIFSKYK